MKIEKLISRYLDGDLSREEDKSLRDIINNDDFARRKFESSVDIHLAMKEDAASISTPDDLMRDTEDVIMMKILNQNPVQQTEKRKRKTPLFYYASAAAIVIMFGLIFRISDSSLFNNMLNGNPEMSYNQYIESLNPNTFVVDVPQANSKTIDADVVFDNQSRSISNNSGSSDNVSKSTALIQPFENNTGNENFALAQDTEFNYYETKIHNEIPVLSIKTIDTDDNKVSDEINHNIIFTANSTNIPFNGVLFLNNNIPYYSYVNVNSLLRRNKINISSSVANSFIENGIVSGGDESVVNFSQSIAYHSSDRLSFGLEFGYLDFNSTKNIPSSGGNTDYNEISVNSSVEVQDPTKSEDFVPALLPVVVNNRLFWGSVFVNYDLLEYKNIVLEGRLGTGATSDGPLSYARIQARYEIYNGIYLNFGSEGRFFIYNISGKNLSASNLSFIYGIQFAFD